MSTTSTCKNCWQDLVRVNDPHRPVWVHAGTGRATCAGGHLPIAEPITPTEMAERRWTA